MDVGSRQWARVRAVALPFPRKLPRPELARLLPSGRSIVVGLALLAAGAGAYLAARETSLFAVRAVEIAGAPSAVEAEVRRQLADAVGVSLLRVDTTELERRVESLPTVATASLDRAFPNTLRVVLRPERGVVVLRQRSAAWLASGWGRVIASVDARALPRAPRVWLPAAEQVVVGETVSPQVQAATRAVALAGPRLAGAVPFVRLGPEELTLVLRSGFELRLGDGSDARLKLAVMRRVLAKIPPRARTRGGYIDVSLAGRPVAYFNPEVAG